MNKVEIITAFKCVESKPMSESVGTIRYGETRKNRGIEQDVTTHSISGLLQALKDRVVPESGNSDLSVADHGEELGC